MLKQAPEYVLQYIFKNINLNISVIWCTELICEDKYPEMYTCQKQPLGRK